MAEPSRYGSSPLRSWLRPNSWPRLRWLLFPDTNGRASARLLDTQKSPSQNHPAMMKAVYNRGLAICPTPSRGCGHNGCHAAHHR